MTKKQHNCHPKIDGRSCGIIGKITLYNQQGEIISNIYPRRAKQLVLNGKAVWLKEGQTLQIVQNIINSTSESEKENKFMIDEKVCPTNGEPKKAVHHIEEADALLLYQAKLNVRDKRNLLKHILAFVVAWPVLGIFYAGILDNMTHPSWWRASNIINNLTAVQSYLPIERSADVNSAVNFMTSYFRHNHVPDIWYVIVGVMLAWGAWIAFRVAKRMTRSVAKRFRTYFVKKGKYDPVMREYNRLRGLATEETP